MAAPAALPDAPIIRILHPCLHCEVSWSPAWIWDATLARTSFRYEITLVEPSGKRSWDQLTLHFPGTKRQAAASIESQWGAVARAGM